MNFKTRVRLLLKSLLDGAVSPSDDDYKYLLRKRDGTYYSRAGYWVKRKDKAQRIKGADNAWNYAKSHLGDYIEDIDVVIP